MFEEMSGGFSIALFQLILFIGCIIAGLLLATGLAHFIRYLESKGRLPGWVTWLLEKLGL